MDLRRESDEIFKAIEKAAYQLDKYKSHVYDLSDRHQKRVIGGGGAAGSDCGTLEYRMSSSSRASSASSLPKVIDFQIGDQVSTPGGGYISLGGDSEAISLIDENHTLLDA